jgi:hypothetical protein
MIVTRNIYQQICPFIDEKINDALHIVWSRSAPWRIREKMTNVVVVDDMRIPTWKLNKVTTPRRRCKCLHRLEIEFFFGSDSFNYYTWEGCNGCGIWKNGGPQLV